MLLLVENEFLRCLKENKSLRPAREDEALSGPY